MTIYHSTLIYSRPKGYSSDLIKHLNTVSFSHCFTWKLWIDSLDHVLRKVAWHLSPDVHEHSGLCGGDLVNEHWTWVSEHQLCMIGFELRAILKKTNV